MSTEKSSARFWRELSPAGTGRQGARALLIFRSNRYSNRRDWMSRRKLGVTVGGFALNFFLEFSSNEGD